MPNLRTVAFSDLHLGRKNSRLHTPEELAPLAQGFDRVLLLGDILDHWYLTPHQIKDLEARVRNVCHKAGARQVVWIRGNHDAATEGGEEYALLHGVLYLHGHALYHKLKGNGPLAERIRDLNDRKFGHRRISSRLNKRGWALFDVAYRNIPQALCRPLVWHWGTRHKVRKLAGEVAENGDASVRALVFGHSHCPAVKRVGDLTVFNLGGWMKNTRACGFIKEGTRCRLVSIENGHGAPRWGKVLHEVKVDHTAETRRTG
ncbi:MAG: metallophosphoesterase family protein [Planctomycetes bacterium]|nr:metallophosphoesterase family protein [Planctomycetota bacterium]